MKQSCIHIEDNRLQLSSPCEVAVNGAAGSREGLENFAEVLALLSENIYSGVILCDGNCRILYMNKFYADILKTDQAQAVGRHIKEYFPASRVPVVLDTGKMEMGGRCSLKADIDFVVNRIPIKKAGETIGVVLQTVFRRYTEIKELMTRVNLLEKKVKRYKRGLDTMLSATYSFDDILGDSKSIVGARRLAEKYARTDAPVLILGATGTGKELFSHAIHLASRRRDGPFVCVNCAAIPKELLESELFGYETGAFTGARRKGKPGKIELADGGTLFLDEIGDISMDAQAKLLRVLESGDVEKVGGVKPVRVDFRLIAATNKDLKEAILRKDFREDLLYRLNSMTVNVPPLSERTDDIPLLTDHFLDAMGRPSIRVGEKAMAMLKAYAWPGNVRELKNVIERAVSLCEGDFLDTEHLPSDIRNIKTVCLASPADPIKPLGETLACFEMEVLSDALRRTRGNMARTARLLGISRSTLYEKCRIHGIK